MFRGPEQRKRERIKAARDHNSKNWRVSTKPLVEFSIFPINSVARNLFHYRRREFSSFFEEISVKNLRSWRGTVIIYAEHRISVSTIFSPRSSRCILLRDTIDIAPRDRLNKEINDSFHNRSSKKKIKSLIKSTLSYSILSL